MKYNLIHRIVAAMLFFACCSVATAQTPINTQADAVAHLPLYRYQVLQPKANFVYTFYLSYMSSIAYDNEQLNQATLNACTTRQLRKKMRQYDYDILLDAQDCIPEALATLRVSPQADDWFEVHYTWPQSAVTQGNNTPTTPSTSIRVKVTSDKRGYRLSDVTLKQ